MGKVFLIYTNIHKDTDLSQTERIKNLLLGKDCKVYLYHEIEEQSFPTDIDYMLVLGGDGTMLQALRDVKDRHIPMLGINLGTLGYMTEVEPEQVEVAIDKLLSGQAKTEERMMLKATVSQQGQNQAQQWALNDVVVSRRGPLQIYDFNIYVNGQFLKRYSADGIIVTTPTGSTGYNLSAGGPIVDPKTQLLMITPICPHTFNQRTIVLSADDEIVVEIPAGKEGKDAQVEASFDGSHQMMLQTGDRITISKWEKEAVFLKLNQVSFLEILSRKMSEN
ncbi:MAG: NAD(+)/NADH kinase [Lachnospiraceae bacterium]|nr:NAD(+)/NADH kinase [Lachnospiraceae bacterium]